MKTCGNFKKEKPIDDFPLKRKGLPERRSMCKGCKRAKLKEWRDKNRDHVRRNDVEYYHRTIEIRRADARRYATKHADKIAEKKKAYRKTEHCREVQAKYSSKYYHEKLKDTEKQRTRNTTNTEIRAGRMVKMPCVFCGNKKSESHHPDYSDPFNIVWLCRKHHNLMHKAIKEDFKGEYKL